MYHNAQPQANRVAHQEREPITVVAVPAVTIVGSRMVVGDSSSTSTRSYTPLKVMGDGSFGTVWLCDWHGLFPPNTQLSPMQRGAGARPEWAGKRLVAVKRMKKRWEGGWDECRKLKELEALRAIPPHPNVIPIYDFFLLPSSKELYFVFESMEGNLYQLIKSRKSRPLAGGLVSSIFRQVVSGLHHIHISGYFHRDMKPENLLVTTTGLADYTPVSPVAPPNAPPEKDVVVIIKLADFGLARETTSKPPYTEYVSTRWYRAPEVLLHSRDYSNPVDLWALGTIMVELVTLRPLFPGQGEIDQVIRLCQCLGDPSDEYGVDNRGRSIGGGPWPRGIKLASKVGFTFPKHTPIAFHSLFESSVPPSLIECIIDLLKYDPDQRLTSRQCMEHRYLAETAFSQPQSVPVQLSISTSQLTPPSSSVHVNHIAKNGRSPIVAPSAITNVSPRSLPPSHSQTAMNGKLHLNGNAHPLHPPVHDNSTPHRVPFYQRNTEDMPTPLVIPSALQQQQNATYDHMDGVEQHGATDVVIVSPSSVSPYADRNSGAVSNWMQVSPQEAPWDHAHSGLQNGMPIHESPARPPDDHLSSSMDHDMFHDPTQTHQGNGNNQGKAGKFSSFNKKRGWGFGSMFHTHDKMQPPPLPTVEETNPLSTTSTPSLKRTQSGSTDSHSLPDISPAGPPAPQVVVTSTMDPKRVKKEAARIAREAEKQKRILAEKAHREQARAVLLKQSQIYNRPGAEVGLGRADWGTRQLTGGELVRPVVKPMNSNPSLPQYTHDSQTQWSEGSDQLDHPNKARRRIHDDDHSMSSSDLQSARMSMISFASVDSDPGPTRPMRHRPTPYSTISRTTSYSSLRALSPSNRSSTSIEGQLVNDFNERLTGFSSGTSSPPVNPLSLTPNGHSQQSWKDLSYSPHTPNGLSNGLHLPPVSSFDSLSQLKVPGPSSPYEYGSNPSSPGGISPAINPMFQVPPSMQQGKFPLQPLPPFSHLASVAEQHHENNGMLPPIQDVPIDELQEPDPG